jgi:hypothetical protein
MSGKKRIWDSVEHKYAEDFVVYLSVSMSEDYSPQEITKDLREFSNYLIEKHSKKSNPAKWWEKWIK